ncbi:MAG: WD40/YVTN/BNR-like repeat-containing protein [Aureliella sp.]
MRLDRSGTAPAAKQPKQSAWLFAFSALTACLTFSCTAVAQVKSESLSWELGPTGSKSSLRGLTAPTDRVIWACGSQATVLLSSDGGSSWQNVSPSGFNEVEFRSVHAWSAKEACIASAGQPAVLLRTIDGGESWQEVYRAEDEAAFFDGMQFWDQRRGIVFSDPVGPTMLVLETADRGLSWTRIDPKQLVPVLEGEAGFAASNSSIAVASGGRVWIGTGGQSAEQSRVHMRTGWNADWQVVSCPLESGSASGIFSIAASSQRMVAVGGDYRPEAKSKTTAALSDDGGKSWRIGDQPPPTYRSAVQFLPLTDSGQAEVNQSENGLWIATGPTGSDWSLDGDRWESFTDTGFHVLAVGKNEIFAAGSEGRFAVLRRK